VKRLARVLILAFVGIGIASPVSAQGFGVRKKKNPARVKGNSQQMKQQLDRLSEMEPAERKRMLDRLPAERRREAERRLKMYEKLTPAERQKLASGWGEFQTLRPEQRNQVRRLFLKFNDLPEDRRPLVRSELQQLRRLNDEDRRARINSDEFRNKYSQNEQLLLSELSKALQPDLE